MNTKGKLLFLLQYALIIILINFPDLVSEEYYQDNRLEKSSESNITDNFNISCFNDLLAYNNNLAEEEPDFQIGKQYVIHYSRDTMKITGELEDFLIKASKFLKNNNLTIVFSIHSDSRGSIEKTMSSQHEFSKVINNYLLENGITQSRIIGSWKGSLFIVASNETPEGRKMNNRIEFSFLEK